MDEIFLTTCNFLQQPIVKALLILGDNSYVRDVQELIALASKNKGLFAILIDVSDISNIEEKLLNAVFDKPIVFVFMNVIAENLFVKYRLERWQQAKTIFICDRSLFHPGLNLSIYFAPIRDNIIQRNQLLQFKLPLNTKLAHPIATEIAKELQSVTNTGGDILSQNHYLNKKLLTNDALQMQLLADRVAVNNGFKRFLLALVYASRNNSKMQIAAANAISILNSAAISFAGMNLDCINISHAYLVGGIFVNTSLKRANLTGVNFKNASLSNADFTDSIMMGVMFDELPYLEAAYEVHACCISYNSRFLAACLNNMSVKVYSLPRNEIISTFETELSENAIQFQPQTYWLAIASKWDATKSKTCNIEMHNIVTGESKVVPTYHEVHILTMQFDINGNYLITIDNDDTLIVWAIDKKNMNYQYFKKVDVKYFNMHRDNIKNITFDVSCKYLIFPGIEDIKLWKIDSALGESHELSISPECYSQQYCLNVCFSPNGQIIVGSVESKILVWTRIGKLLHILNDHFDRIRCIEFNNDNNLISCGDDNTIRIWSLEQAICLRVLRAHTSAVTSVRYSTDYNYIVSTSEDHSIRFWNLNVSLPADIELNGFYENIGELCISPDGKYLATVSSSGTLRIWLVFNGHCLYKLQLDLHHDNPIEDSICLQFSPDSLSVVFSNGHGRMLNIWKFTSEKYSQILSDQLYELTCIRFAPDSHYIVAAGISIDEDDKTLFKKDEFFSVKNNFVALQRGEYIAVKWDFFTREIECQFHGHSRQINDVQISGNGRYMATASGGTVTGEQYDSDNAIKIWDMNTRTCQKTLKGGDEEAICKIAFSSDGKLLASRTKTSGNECRIRIWDIFTGQCKRIINEYETIYLSSSSSYFCAKDDRHVLLFSPDNEIIFSGEGIVLDNKLNKDGLPELRMWSTINGKLLNTIKGIGKATAYTLSFQNNTAIIAAADTSNHSIMLWQQEKANLVSAKWFLMWTKNPTLNARQCNIKQVTGLSSENHQLLKQYGAII